MTEISLKKLLVIGAVCAAASGGIAAVVGLSKNNPFIPDETPSNVSDSYYVLYDRDIGKDKALLLCNEGISGTIPEYHLKIKTKFMDYVYEDVGMDGILESYTKDFSKGKGLFTRVYMKGTRECKKAQLKYLDYMNKIQNYRLKKRINTKLLR